MTEQEVAALTLVGAAAVYLVRRLTDWPKRRRKPSAQVSSRLARGLEAAERRRRDPGDDAG